MKHAAVFQDSGQSYNFRHLKSKKKHNLAKVLIAIAIIIVLIIAGGIFALSRLQQNIVTEPLNTGVSPKITPTEPADVAVDPLNILLIGTDTRKGNEQYGGEDQSAGYGFSDVMLLLHLSADKRSASVVSFPRDTMGPLPSCKNPDTGAITDATTYGQLNSSLNIGGPGCTVAAISDITGLPIDHMMLADFNAVKELSNTIGGVEVCVTEAVNDEKSGLKLPSGTSEVQGEQALAFLRTRSAFGDGSDLGRIKAQQSFIASLARKLTSEGTLTDIPKVYSIADTITKNLTVDDGLANTSELIKLADRMRKIDTSKIELITAPIMPDPYDLNRVAIDEDKAAPVFEAISKDLPVSSVTEPTPSATPSAPVEEVPAPEYDRSILDLDITNRSGIPSRAENMQQILAVKGYILSTVNKDDTLIPSSQVLYTYGFKEYADQLAKDLGLPESQVQYSDLTASVSLVVGRDLALSSKILEPVAGLSPELQGQTANQATCQAVN